MKICLLLLPLLLAACTGVPDAANRALVPGTSTSPVLTLQRYHWQLSDAVDADGKRIDTLFDQPAKPLQLDFNDQRVSVSNACNAISGGYRIVEGHLETRILLQTMMACMDPTLQQREAVIKNTLQGKPLLTLSNSNGEPHLSLVGASGRTLTFTGKATAATRYGGPGETVFLEVAAQTIPCSQSDDASTSCLRVRDRHYDDNGLNSGTPGPWHTMQQPIEDFVPQTGVRYVLRLTRYTLKPSSAAKPTAAYVLDTIVESGPAQASN